MRRGWAVFFLVAAACGTAEVSRPAAMRVVSSPAPTAKPTIAVKAVGPAPKVATPAPKTAPPAPKAPGTTVARPAVRPAVAPVPDVGLTSFRGLGAWIDVFDHTDDPATIVPAVRKAAALGTKTLYLETARYASKTDIQYPRAVGAALDEAKARGMRVVAWYPPDFKDLKRDVNRSLAAIRFRSPKGNRFDAFGADIEYTAGVPDHKERNKRTLQYTAELRKGAGAAYPLAAIVIPPSWLELNAHRWPEFPWRALAASYDLFMPMNYWTARGESPENAYNLTRSDAEETKRLTGRPIHIIGGLGEDADEPQTNAYVRAARDAGSIGGGLYDLATTRPEVWDELRSLNR